MFAFGTGIERKVYIFITVFIDSRYINVVGVFFGAGKNGFYIWLYESCFGVIGTLRQSQI